MKLYMAIKLAKKIVSSCNNKYRICSSIRRCKEKVKDIDILICRENIGLIARSIIQF